MRGLRRLEGCTVRRRVRGRRERRGWSRRGGTRREWVHSEHLIGALGLEVAEGAVRDGVQVRPAGAAVDVALDDALGVQPQRGVRVHTDEDGPHEGVDLVAGVAAPMARQACGESSRGSKGLARYMWEMECVCLHLACGDPTFSL